MRLRPLRIAITVLGLSSVAHAAPVTGWLAVHPTTGAASTKPFFGSPTDSPVLGNGSEDSAAMVAMYADISGARDAAADVALANGERVTLSGFATLTGITSAIEQFRWGLFYEGSAPFDASGWRGFIASNSAGFGGGALRAKEVEGGTFAQTGSAVNLRTAQDGDDFMDEEYHFSMSITRFNNELVVDASLTSANDWAQVWKNVAATSPTPPPFEFNRVGFLAGNGMHANQISFSNIDVTKAAIAVPTLQVVTTGPYAGAVQIRNGQVDGFEIEYYEIVSSAGSLSVSGWNSLDNQESDPDLVGWEEAAGNGSQLLSEYMLSAATYFAPGTSLSLGQAFDVEGAEDLKFYIGLADGTLLRGIVDYVPSGLAGDYNDDGVVDAADYLVWRKNAGTSNSLSNDPLGGRIGAGQFNLWSANFGAVSGAASGTAVPAAVPEPGTILMLAVAALAAIRRSPRAWRDRS